MKKYAVYGTLRLDQGNYNWCLKNQEGVRHVETKTISGYDMFSLGGFPGIKKSNGDIVVDIFEVDNPNVEQNLDGLEGYNENNLEGSMYVKDKTDEGEFIYIWNSAREGQKIEDGDWVKFNNQNKRVYV